MNEADFLKCACRHCSGHIEFPSEAAGSVVACPHCEQPVTLVVDDPLPAPEEAQPASQLTPAGIAAAFQGGVPRTRVSIFYQLGLVIVAVTMVILPPVYFALIGAAGWGVYKWATEGTFLLGGGGGGRLFIIKVMLYLTPLFVGIVVVFFMIKPLLARRAPAAQPLGLNPSMQPVLFALIRCICDAVKAPFPKRVYVDCHLNAAAGFRRGLLSFFGNDLMLLIGMPLVAGLTARQFAGILAHEFGHFTQGFGMRLTYLIRTINMWFARIAYERDAWDVTLDEWADEADDWRVMIVVNLARAAVWFSRLILKLLLFVGHAIGCFMLRQMEYDADSYETKLVGSGTFESASLRLRVLGAALGMSYKEMRVGWNLNRRLPEDFPAYMLAHDAVMKPEVRAQIENTAGLATTGIFDTHPSDGDRIRQARRADEPGVFDLDAPATALFSNFDVLARQVTHLHYEDDLGIPVAMAKLHPVEPFKRAEPM